jgi:hypothetical protein
LRRLHFSTRSSLPAMPIQYRPAETALIDSCRAGPTTPRCGRTRSWRRQRLRSQR